MRRPIIFLAIALLSTAAAACTDLAAPRHDDGCPSGYVTTDGRMVCADSLK